MITGITKSGFEFEVDENAGDNMELVDALADTEDNDMLAVSKVGKLLLGSEIRKKLYDHIRVDGRVPIRAAVDELMEIISFLGNKGKN